MKTQTQLMQFLLQLSNCQDQLERDQGQILVLPSRLSKLHLFLSYINLIMSAIKSSSGDFEPSIHTPLKYHPAYLNTNASLALSSTTGLTRQGDFEDRRSGWRSSELLKDFPSAEIMTIRAQDIQNNTSQMTINCTISSSDIQDLLDSKKMIVFLAGLSNQQKLVITHKQDKIKRMNEEIDYRQQTLLRHKNKYKQMKSYFDGLKKRTEKRERARSVAFQREIIQMEAEIRKMRRTLSNRKMGRETENKEKRPYKKKHKRIIYVPLAYGPPHVDKNQDMSSHTIYSQAAPYHKPDNRQQNIRNDHFPQKREVKQSRTPGISINIPPPQTTQQNYKQRKYSQPQSQDNLNVLQLLQLKLRTNNVLPPPIESQQREGMIRTRDVTEAEKILEKQKRISNQLKPQQSSNIFGLLSSRFRPQVLPYLQSQNQEGLIRARDIAEAERQMARQQGGFNIQIHSPEIREKEKADPLDYLNDETFKNIQAEEITAKRSKGDTSIQNEDPQSDGEKEVRKTLNLINESIRKSEEQIHLLEPIPDEKEILKSTAKKMIFQPKSKQNSDIGAKMVESQLKNNEFDDFTLPEKSRIKDGNCSDVDISYDSSDKRNSRIDESAEKKSRKDDSSRKLLNIAQSNVNIILESLNTSNSPRQGSNSSTPKYEPPSKLSKQIYEIEEVQDEDMVSRQNTPLDTQLGSYSIQQLMNSIGSRGQSRNGFKSSNNQLEGSSTPKTPILSQPPSLIEQNNEDKRGEQEENDFLSNINLSPQSRRVQQISINSAIKSRYETPKEEEDDDIFSINLVTESRISRDRKSQEKNFEVFDNVAKQMMARSEPADYRRHSLQQKIDTDEQEIRNSTTSSFVRRGSAIQKVKNRAVVNNIKMSNYGSPGKGSKLSSTPIEQAEEELENADLQGSRNKRHQSSLR